MWKKFTQYINAQTEFTRKDMREFFGKDFCYTLDVYRQYLTKGKYIKRTGRGKYKRIKAIPVTLSKSVCVQTAYGNNKLETEKIV